MRETDRGWPGIDNVSPNTHARVLFDMLPRATRLYGAGYVAEGIFFLPSSPSPPRYVPRETTHGNDTEIKRSRLPERVWRGIHTILFGSGLINWQCVRKIRCEWCEGRDADVFSTPYIRTATSYLNRLVEYHTYIQNSFSVGRSRPPSHLITRARV